MFTVFYLEAIIKDIGSRMYVDCKMFARYMFIHLCWVRCCTQQPLHRSTIAPLSHCTTEPQYLFALLHQNRYACTDSHAHTKQCSARAHLARGFISALVYHSNCHQTWHDRPHIKNRAWAGPKCGHVPSSKISSINVQYTYIRTYIFTDLYKCILTTYSQWSMYICIHTHIYIYMYV